MLMPFSLKILSTSFRNHLRENSMSAISSLLIASLARFFGCVMRIDSRYQSHREIADAVVVPIDGENMFSCSCEHICVA